MKAGDKNTEVHYILILFYSQLAYMIKIFHKKFFKNGTVEEKNKEHHYKMLDLGWDLIAGKFFCKVMENKYFRLHGLCHNYSMMPSELKAAINNT